MRVFALLSTLALAACGGHRDQDPRGVEPDETLLSVSATGRNETKPDMATFSAGIETTRANAKAASVGSAEDMQKLVAALAAVGIAKKDIQTQNVSVYRIDYGKEKGMYRANNQVTVRVRQIDKASEAIGAATEAGANILSGPALTLSDPEKARLSAYGAAYKAAKARADAYAEAAGLKVTRILTIRDGGDISGPGPQAYEEEADAAYAVAPPPLVSASGPPISAGSDINVVTVSVQFALERQ